MLNNNEHENKNENETPETDGVLASENAAAQEDSAEQKTAAAQEMPPTGAKHFNRFMLFFTLQFIIISEGLSFAVRYFEIEADAFAFQSFGYPIVLLPPIVLYFSFTGRKVKDVFHLAPLGAVNTTLVIIAAVTLWPLLLIVLALSSLFLPGISGASMGAYTHIPLWAMVLSAALIPAVFEELVFRGILLSKTNETPFRAKVLLSAFFFAIIHFSPEYFLYAFVSGLFLALITYITRSVAAPVIAHFCWSAFSVWVVYAGEAAASGQAAADAPVQIADTLITLAFILIITLPLFLFAVYLLIINNKDKIIYQALLSRFKRVNELNAAFKLAYAAPDSPKNVAAAPKAVLPPVRPRALTWEFWAVCAVYAGYVVMVLLRR